uniref:Uncharacterized protein n=1 Tax=Caenorhabditis japonica TaxID=281687 RepID=A0A8R1EX71_CAEJA
MGGEIAAATRSMIPPGPLADLVADISVAQQIAPAPPPPPPPPLPAQKQRRSRKTNNAKLSSSQEFLPENLAMPSSSMECLVTPTPPTPTPSSPIPPTNGGGGGGAVTPRVSVLPKQHRVYSLKPPVPKFPVKKVLPPPNGVTPHPLLSPQNANSSQTITIRNAFMTKRSPVIPQQQSPQFLSTFPSKEPILQQKQPWYLDERDGLTYKETDGK